MTAMNTNDIPAIGSSSLTLTAISTPPLVNIDSLAPGATITGTVTVSGWAIDSTTAGATVIGSVQIMVDGALAGIATYGTSRPDVCVIYAGRPGCPNVGFTYQLNTTLLSPGQHTITAVAMDTDGTPDSGSYVTQVTVY
jgi:hypothetical protein